MNVKNQILFLSVYAIISFFATPLHADIREHLAPVSMPLSEAESSSDKINVYELEKKIQETAGEVLISMKRNAHVDMKLDATSAACLSWKVCPFIDKKKHLSSNAFSRIPVQIMDQVTIDRLGIDNKRFVKAVTLKLNQVLTTYFPIKNIAIIQNTFNETMGFYLQIPNITHMDNVLSPDLNAGQWGPEQIIPMYLAFEFFYASPEVIDAFFCPADQEIKNIHEFFPDVTSPAKQEYIKSSIAELKNSETFRDFLITVTGIKRDKKEEDFFQSIITEASKPDRDLTQLSLLIRKSERYQRILRFSGELRKHIYARFGQGYSQGWSQLTSEAIPQEMFFFEAWFKERIIPILFNIRQNSFRPDQAHSYSETKALDADA